MSTEAPAAQKKINLRRPDILEAVQAQVLSHYRSELVERVRAKRVHATSLTHSRVARE